MIAPTLKDMNSMTGRFGIVPGDVEEIIPWPESGSSYAVIAPGTAAGALLALQLPGAVSFQGSVS